MVQLNVGDRVTLWGVVAPGKEPVMVQLNVGDRVTLFAGNYDGVGNASYRTYRVNAGQELTVTRVYSESFTARGALPGGQRSISVPRYSIVSINGLCPTTGTTRRPLGTPPEDTDDLVHIHLDDPGIQWLFKDMAEFAKDQRWCEQYDQLCGELGIPGREQEWVVRTTRNGISISATISATSIIRAEDILESMLIAAE